MATTPVPWFILRKKKQVSERIGIGFKLFNYPENILEKELIQEIKQIQQAEEITGLIIQLPLPAGLDSEKVITALDPKMDVDCLTKINLDKIVAGDPYLISPTPGAILEILNYYNIILEAKKIVVVGQGQLVGQPLCLLLQQLGLPLTLCIKSVADNQPEILVADIIITGVGKPKLITAEMVKSGAVVIDAGVSLVNGKTVGDVDFEGLKDKASLITAPIGGVGPVTVAKLLENVVRVADSS